MLEKEISMVGYKAVSEHGVLLVRLSDKSIERVAKHNEQIRNLKTEVLVELKKEGPCPLDFIRYNDNSPT